MKILPVVDPEDSSDAQSFQFYFPPKLSKYVIEDVCYDNFCIRVNLRPGFGVSLCTVEITSYLI